MARWRAHHLPAKAEKTWLETHVWHAKRMKMENVCGYRIVSRVNVEVGVCHLIFLTGQNTKSKIAPSSPSSRAQRLRYPRRLLLLDP